ncbi:MAG: hypothetical protein IKQ87_07375, partial [Clostridia bacterium]|nr:hypothetical protein [Clostridia bacterium]
MRSIPSVEGNALTRTPQSAEHPKLPESSSFWFFFSSIKEKKNADSAMERERLPHFSVSWE